VNYVIQILKNIYNQHILIKDFDNIIIKNEDDDIIYQKNLEEISKKLVDNIISDVVEKLENESKLKVDLIDNNQFLDRSNDLINNFQENRLNNIIKHDLIQKNIILIQ
jgi:uncharacterized protein YbcC (UPF0753/DUF2309 family)